MTTKNKKRQPDDEILRQYAESARPRVKNDTPTTSGRANLSSTPYNTTIPIIQRRIYHVLPDLRHSAQQSYYHLSDARRCPSISTTLRGRRTTTSQNQLYLQGRASPSTRLIQRALTPPENVLIPTLPQTQRLSPIRNAAAHDDRRQRDSSLEASTTELYDDSCTPAPHSCKMCGVVL